jgi:hypothetical protein
MPTVPRLENVTRDTRESILGTKRKSFPVGQTGPGQYKTLRSEIWRQTAEAQHGEEEIGGKVKILPKQWETFLKQSPKSQNIIERQSPDPQLEPWEARAYSQSIKEADKAYGTKPEPGPVSPMAQALGQGSMKGIATKEMGLNEQEQFLYQHHLDNYAKGGVSSAGGTKTSTVLAITVGQDDKTYVIPTVWNNKVVSKDQAIENADKAGFDKFPSYDSREQANARYSQMHTYMDEDMK